MIENITQAKTLNDLLARSFNVRSEKNCKQCCNSTPRIKRVRRSWLERKISSISPFRAYRCSYCEDRFYAKVK